MPNLPWDVLLRNVPELFTLGLAFVSATALLFLYRLDRIPKLWIPGTVALFLFSRILDVSTFLWASGGEYYAVELNPFYQVTVVYLPHLQAMMLIQTIATVVIGGVLWFLWFDCFPRPLWLAIVAALSAVSLAAATTNVLYFFGLW
ncbi:MAG TPA: hypothetical protein VI794_00675 [Patescibacteria group bacterium]|nr:hypothetical protein [Patescibacteria group bacterium]